MFRIGTLLLVLQITASVALAAPSAKVVTYSNSSLKSVSGGRVKTAKQALDSLANQVSGLLKPAASANGCVPTIEVRGNELRMLYNGTPSTTAVLTRNN